MNLIKQLQEGMAAVTESEMTGSDMALQEGETVIGEVTDPELRRYYTVLGKLVDDWQREVREKVSSILSIEEESDPEDFLPSHILAKVDTGRNKFKALYDLFWAEATANLPGNQMVMVLRSNGIAIRDGWKIVTQPVDVLIATMVRHLGG